MCPMLLLNQIIIIIIYLDLIITLDTFCVLELSFVTLMNTIYNMETIKELKEKIKAAKAFERAKKKLLTTNVDYVLIESILKALNKPNMEVEIKQKNGTSIFFRTSFSKGKEVEVRRETDVY